jgi:hypothetical protein
MRGVRLALKDVNVTKIHFTSLAYRVIHLRRNS